MCVDLPTGRDLLGDGPSWSQTQVLRVAPASRCDVPTNDQPNLQTLVESLRRYQTVGIAPRATGLDLDQDYEAVITEAAYGESRAGNPMMTVEFVLAVNGWRVRGYFVLNHEVGLRKFSEMVEALLGPEALTQQPEAVAFSLIGARVSVRLDSYINQRGGESYNVKSVKAS